VSEHAIVARGVRKSFGEQEVLRGVDLDVAEGEWVAIMGPSGCGKSTLLHLLGGLDRSDAGSIELGGTRVDGADESARARMRRAGVGYVFQFFNLVPHMDVEANVALPGRIAGRSGRAAKARARDLLAATGIAELAHARPATLSGGQQQRVAVARALVNEPTVVLADEPTGALDSASTDTVLDVMRSVHAAGQTIVMVTHDDRVAAAADRIVHMRDGVIVDG
jgi:putative ABC transport system ATP-binding protein